jgi:hypothetical protein
MHRAALLSWTRILRLPESYSSSIFQSMTALDLWNQILNQESECVAHYTRDSGLLNAMTTMANRDVSSLIVLDKTSELDFIVGMVSPERFNPLNLSWIPNTRCPAYSYIQGHHMLNPHDSIDDVRAIMALRTECAYRSFQSRYCGHCDHQWV